MSESAAPVEPVPAPRLDEPCPSECNAQKTLAAIKHRLAQSDWIVCAEALRILDEGALVEPVPPSDDELVRKGDICFVCGTTSLDDCEGHAP